MSFWQTRHRQSDRNAQLHHWWSDGGFLKSGESNDMNIWPRRVDAARWPVDRASKKCSYWALWVLCCWEWWVLLPDTWPHAAGGGSCDNCQLLWKGGWAYVDAWSRMCGDWAAWCSARRRWYARERYRLCKCRWLFHRIHLHAILCAICCNWC